MYSPRCVLCVCMNRKKLQNLYSALNGIMKIEKVYIEKVTWTNYLFKKILIINAMKSIKLKKRNNMSRCSEKYYSLLKPLFL